MAEKKKTDSSSKKQTKTESKKQIDNKKPNNEKKEETKNLDKDTKSQDKKEHIENNDEPSWYHYLIVFGVVALIFFGLWVAFEVYSSTQEPDRDVEADPNSTYIYEHKVDGVTYNIHLSAPVRELERYDFIVEPDVYDVLNTITFRYGFDEYNQSDNGHVSVASIKLTRFLSTVYNYNFDSEESFKTTDELNCTHSTPQHRVIEYKPRANKSGVFIGENDCIVFKAEQPNLLPFITDYFIIHILERR